MKRETRNLAIFLVATFIWTWACYTPIAIRGNNPYSMPWMILLILGGMGPTLVGVLMVRFSKDKEYRLDYWRRCFSFKQIRLIWWLVIFLIFPLLYGLNIAIDIALGGSLPGMEQLQYLIAHPAAIPMTAFISILSGPLAEEFGWRGYALDRIMKPFGIIPGAFVLGLIWGIWHLPLFFMPATGHRQTGWGFDGFWSFILRSAGLSLLITWVYLKTNRSILSAIFIHFTSNFTAQLLMPLSGASNVVNMILMLVFGLIACATFKNPWTAFAPKGTAGKV